MQKQEQIELNQGTKEIVRSFTQHLEDDGKRPKTIESYVGDVVGILAYLKQRGNDFTGDLKRFQITSYRNNLVEKGYEALIVYRPSTAGLCAWV